MTDWTTTPRLAKAIELVNDGRVTTIDHHLYLVQGSEDRPYTVYVNTAAATCSCVYGAHRNPGWENPCAHILAAAAVAEIDVPLPAPEREKESAE